MKLVTKNLVDRVTAIGFLLVIAGFVAACGVNGVPEMAGLRLDRCLEQHGIVNASESQSLSETEALLPGAIARKGLTVPHGVSRKRFETALRECGAADLRIGPLPVTNSRLRQRISDVVMCLNRNGFAIGAPTFSGAQPIIDTKAVDTKSARWVATMFGCRADVSLDGSALSACMGGTLNGLAQGNAPFEHKLVELPSCLKRRAGLSPILRLDRG